MGGEREIGGSSVPKKLKVKTVEDLNSVEEIVEETSVSQPMDVSMESSSDLSNKTTDLEEPSVSGEDRKIEISIEITDDLIWLRDRGKFNRDEGHKTVRTLKRWNWILETIQAHKVVSNVTNILTLINDHERSEGHSGRIDRKSLFRILYRMAVDRLIKVYKVYLRSGDTVQEMNFFCNPSVTPNDPMITFAIDLAKLKFTSKVKLQHDNAAKQESKTVAKEDVVLKNKFDFSEEHKSNLDVPKFMRMRYLHMFMYYLVYGYEGDVDLDQKEAAQQIRASQGFEIDDLESLSFIYVPNASWKMFVPPLPQHREYKDGWALLADIILRLPLSMFMNLVRLPYIVPNLELYLDHPESLIYKRKYVFSIFEVVKRLAYIGLVQLGPQNLKEKDHVYLYLNKNGLLLDTKISRPGYHKVSEDITYDEIRYYFEEIVEVERYWLDMWKICMHTKLGNRSCVVGTDLILENIQDKPDMVSILLAKTREEVVEKDVGYLPGDKLGAAGFDSALFSHLKRNWAFKPFPKTRLKPVLTIPDKPDQKLRKPFKFAEGRNQMVYSLLAKRRKNVVVSTRKPVTTSKSNAVNRKPVATTVNRKQVTKISTVNRKQVLSHKPRVTVRHVKPRPVKQRRPFYDQIDREALKRMNKLRVDWSKAEDKLLLLCKVVQSMISPQIKSGILGNMYISFREILHKTFPNSRNKTSRACQRRINYMLRSQSTCHSLNLCIEELRHDPHIMETYGDLFEKLKTKYENKHGVIENKAKLVAEWNMHFKDLFEILAKRFEDFSIMSLSSETLTIPDTIEEFYANYNVIEPTKKVKTKHGFNPVENVNDIYSSVINSTIHSALCSTSDKTSWSYHLFSIYQQYPERLLRSALAKMRTSQMVSLKRAWSRTKMRSGNYLPLTASPYRLSISYINLMTAKYTSDIFPESYELLKSIVQSGRLDLQVTSGGIAAGVVRLLTDGWVDFQIGIPDQVIVLNPNIQEKDEAYTRLMNRYQEILSSYKQQILTTSCLFQKENYPAIEDGKITEEDSKESSNNNTIARTASRLALFLVKDSEETDDMVPLDIQHVHDFFVVNSCTVVSNLRSNLTEDQLRMVTDMRDVHTFQKQLRETVVYPANLNVNEVLNENFTGDRLDRAVKLLESAKSEGNLGLKCGKIVEEFGNDWEVKEILDELCRLKLLVCTGLVSTTYVHHQHARPWLVHTYSNKRKEKDSRVPMIGGVLELGKEGDVEERGNEETRVVEREGTRVVLEEHVEGVVQDEKKEEFVEVQGDFREKSTSEDKKSYVECDLIVLEKEGEGEEKVCVVDVVEPGSRKRNKSVDDVMEVDCERRMGGEEGMEGEKEIEEEKGIEEENIDGNSLRESVLAEEEMCVGKEKELEKDDEKKCNKDMGKKSVLVDYSEKEGKNREVEEEEFGEKNIFEGSTKQKERENMGESGKGLGEEEKIDKDGSKERGLVQGCTGELGGKSVVQGFSSQVVSVEDGNNQELEKSLEETEEGVSCSRKEGFTGGKEHCDTFQGSSVESVQGLKHVNVAEKGSCVKINQQLKQTNFTGEKRLFSFVKRDQKLKQTNSDKGLFMDRFKVVNYGASTSKNVVCLPKDENMREKRFKEVNYGASTSKDVVCLSEEDEDMKEKRFKEVNYGASTSKGVLCLPEDENMEEKRFKEVNYGASTSKDVVCLSEEDEDMEEKRFKEVGYVASTSKDVVCHSEEDENMEDEMKNWESGEERDHSESETGISSCNKSVRFYKNGGVTAKSPSSENPVLNEPAKSGKDTDLRNLSQPIKVLIRPWIRVDGTVNRRSLDHFLSTVLSHIMQHPLSTLSELQNRFLPALQPQHTRELAEFLEKLKCVESFVCVKSGKPSLFSKPCQVVVKKATGLEAPSEIRLEANKDAIVNLGKLISTKKYDEGLLTLLVDK
ncbi:general transcription factor 3C polypeptide 1-like [Nilaparvata lugens]|uniref:general transcription factor 3C polypeptide 1-like n=1 Tax=Nilaparvata lugens TaxID=108931 RepID=UPI00193D2398|nr:general transcription factor 3C polypeptide 1-like [Nilaparvata lugens]